jgi:poly-gamma-glutamate synthase PgsB/CapB
MAITQFKALIIPAVCIMALLGYFLVEQILLSRRRSRIPLRLCVAGTRGKSTVTRFIASVLREAGFRVAAKTTGSKPVLIAPDGTEKDIVRRGKPSILEQKKVLRIAARMKADALVVEMMSIGPECLRAESGKIVRPSVLVLTNVRLDHLDDMGRTKPEIAASLAAAVPEKGTVFIPEEYFYPVFQEAAAERRARIIRVPTGPAGGADVAPGREFEENVRLTLAVAEFLGIAEAVARAGIEKARPDFGSLKIWKIPNQGSLRERYLVSAFAANEPESTRRVLEALNRRIPSLPLNMIALLNLRADRGDRTGQWLRAFGEGFFDSFDRIVLIGDQTSAAERKISRSKRWGGKVSAISSRRPDAITALLLSFVADGGVVVGMGNMGGLGGPLLENWAAVGVPA